MATTSPARIDDDLYASAKLAGEVQSRSASRQVAHWARIGREIEASAIISHKDIAEVLAGCQLYDSLSAKEQALVKVRERYARLWPLVASAIGVVDAATVYDNSRAATPFRVVAGLEHGSVVRGLAGVDV